MLGDSAFRFYVTPGHTPGSLSMEYIVSDGDQLYRALTPGGLGFNQPRSRFSCFFSSVSCLRMYLRMTCSAKPTVLTQYPRAQKW